MLARERQNFAVDVFAFLSIAVLPAKVKLGIIK